MLQFTKKVSSLKNDKDKKNYKMLFCNDLYYM